MLDEVLLAGEMLAKVGVMGRRRGKDRRRGKNAHVAGRNGV